MEHERRMVAAPISPFAVLGPRADAPESAVIVEVPHAGIYVDPTTSDLLIAPARAIVQDADLLVDELYQDAPGLGATLLCASYSRYVVDLNRAEGDVDGGSVRGVGGPQHAPRGVVWRLTGQGQPVLRAPLEPDELERRLALVYRPYHAALEGLIERKLERFGVAIVLAAHSMPSFGVSRGGVRTARADVVPGTRGRTSAGALYIDAVDGRARAGGYSVAHDDPYRGGFTTTYYGRPRARVHVVQIELARRLYLDEATLERTAGFARTRQLCRELVADLVRVASR